MGANNQFTTNKVVISKVLESLDVCLQVVQFVHLLFFVALKAFVSRPFHHSHLCISTMDSQSCYSHPQQ